ncbi:uncharacterized protein GGS22DRAFT_157639 [Annulohypoxylon maeteangense]|uniref:uncharacterized protein n=1 Tax=Annulohypoxylon maeteangense TaxID=1927788 RepID=UPI002007630F|nr:uncharacterized protein GGS22DRAFT_157639 [Annulohypoxylon maeteangense]KAI0887622.1 hypothetical protein GGS22DRAFT_157639 [Annulohypoxylon maeteangense]
MFKIERAWHIYIVISSLWLLSRLLPVIVIMYTRLRGAARQEQEKQQGKASYSAPPSKSGAKPCGIRGQLILATIR